MKKKFLIKNKIKSNCSPRHVPSLIIACPDIPRAKSGKIVEIAVKKIINGETINNIQAIANPEALDFYKKLMQMEKTLKQLL